MSAQSDFSDYVTAWLSGVGEYTITTGMTPPARTKTMWPPLSFPPGELENPPMVLSDPDDMNSEMVASEIVISNAKLGSVLIEDLSNTTEMLVSVDPDKNILGISAGYEIEAQDGRIKVLGGETADVIMRLNLTLAVWAYDDMDTPDVADDVQFTRPMRLPKFGIVSDRFVNDMTIDGAWSDLSERILSSNLRLEQRVTPTDGVMAYNLIMDFQLRR